MLASWQLQVCHGEAFRHSRLAWAAFSAMLTFPTARSLSGDPKAWMLELERVSSDPRDP
jgi:hypothetical protein